MTVPSITLNKVCLSGLDAIALAAQLLRMGTVRVLRFSFPVVLGLRLHLVCTLQGLPAALALTGAKADEREVLLAVFTAEPP